MTAPPTPPNNASAPAEVAIDDERIREHLANERTFLAWVRTGIAMMGFGVVLVRLQFLEATPSVSSGGLRRAAWIGLVFAGIGLLMVVLSGWRYQQVRTALRARRYSANNPLLWVLTLLICLMGAGILGYLLSYTFQGR